MPKNVEDLSGRDFSGYSVHPEDERELTVAAVDALREEILRKQRAIDEVDAMGPEDFARSVFQTTYPPAGTGDISPGQATYPPAVTDYISHGGQATYPPAGTTYPNPESDGPFYRTYPGDPPGSMYVKVYGYEGATIDNAVSYYPERPDYIRLTTGYFLNPDCVTWGSSDQGMTGYGIARFPKYGDPALCMLVPSGIFVKRTSRLQYMEKQQRMQKSTRRSDEHRDRLFAENTESEPVAGSTDDPVRSRPHAVYSPSAGRQVVEIGKTLGRIVRAWWKGIP